MKAALTAGALAIALAIGGASQPARAQERPSAQLQLASQTPWVRGTPAFTMRLDVDRVRRPDQLDLVVVVHRAVTSRSQFARTIEGDLLGASIYRDRRAFQDLTYDAGGAAPVAIDLPTLKPGVYPVAVDLVDRSTNASVASLVTHLVRVPDDPVKQPLAVAWVQPYSAPPALRADGTTALSATALNDLRAVAAHIDDGTPVTMAPTPETVAALGTLDAGVTTRALAKLFQGHQVISTPFVDLDVSAMVGAGRTQDLARQRNEGDRVLTSVLGVSGDTRTWSVAGALTLDAIGALVNLGVDRAVVDEAALKPLPSSLTGGLTLSRPFAISGAGQTSLDAVAVDPGLAAHFREPDDVLAAHHLLADLAVLQLDAPGTARGVVIRPPDGTHPSDAFLSTALSNIASSPLLSPMSLDELFASVDPLVDSRNRPVVRPPATTSAPPFGIPPSEIDRARAETASLASIADASTPELEILDRLAFVAETRSLRASVRQRYVDAIFARVAGAAAKVRVLGDRTYRLTAREGKIPLTFVNDNPFDVRIDVELTSDKLTFTKSSAVGSERLPGLALKAHGTTTQVIPVKARTSGAFPMRVALRSPDGRLELGRTSFTITSTVASGVGIVLSAGAALFLLLWWGSHWRTVRRAKRLVMSQRSPA